MGSPFGRHAATATEIATLGSHNDLRFFVDPLNPLNAHADVNAAYAAAVARLPAGTDVVIELSSNTAHNIAPALTVDTDRNLIIKVAGNALDSNGFLPTTLGGTIVLPDASGEPHRRSMTLSGIRLHGNVTQGPSWDIVYHNTHIAEGQTTRTNGGTGCNTSLVGCKITTLDSPFIDADANAGLYVLINTQIDVFAAGTGPHTIFDMTAADETSLRFYSCNFILANISDTLSLIDAGAPSGGMYIDFYDTKFQCDNFLGTTSIIANGNANIYTTWSNTDISAATETIAIGVDDNDPIGWPKYVGEEAPGNPKPGMLWVNPVTGRSAIYRYHAATPYWQWSDWAEGEGFVDLANGDATASAGSFETVNQAWLALDNNTLAGHKIQLTLNGKIHILTADLTLNALRDTIFTSIPKNIGSTIINGNNLFDIIIPSADAAPIYRTCTFEGIILQGLHLKINSNWKLQLFNFDLHETACIQRTHGANGNILHARNSNFNLDGSLHSVMIEDIDAWAGSAAATTLNFYDCKLHIPSLAADTDRMFKLTKANINLERCTFYLKISNRGTVTMINAQGAGGSQLLHDCTLHISSSTIATFKLGENLNAFFKTRGEVIIRGSDQRVTIDLNVNATEYGQPIIIFAKLAPINMWGGEKWTNIETGTVLIWNGAYWGLNNSKFHSLNHSNIAATKIIEHTLPTNTIYKIKAEITGRLRDGPPSSEYRSVTLEATCTHLQGAAAAIVGAITSVHDVGNGASAGWTMTLAANGDDIEVQATTGVAESCDWKAKISWEEIASLA